MSLSLNPRSNDSRYNLVKHLVKKANSTLVKKRQQIQATDSQGNNVSLNSRWIPRWIPRWDMFDKNTHWAALVKPLVKSLVKNLSLNPLYTRVLVKPSSNVLKSALVKSAL